jgi:hypothetical protein
MGLGKLMTEKKKTYHEQLACSFSLDEIDSIQRAIKVLEPLLDTVAIGDLTLTVLERSGSYPIATVWYDAEAEQFLADTTIYGKVIS